MRKFWIVFRVEGDQCLEVARNLTFEQSQRCAERLTVKTRMHHWSVEEPADQIWTPELRNTAEGAGELPNQKIR